MSKITWIQFTCDDTVDYDFKKGAIGYIDGYLYHEAVGPLVCIVVKDEIVLAKFKTFKVIKAPPIED